MEIEKILVVDDEPIIRNFLYDFFQIKKKEIQIFEDGKAAIEALSKESFDLVITDMKMPRASGIDVLKYCQSRLNVPVIIMTAFGSIENAVEAMKCGAFHYLIKPFTLDALDAVLKKAEEHISLVKENKYLKDALSPKHKIITKNPFMLKTLQNLKKIAKTNVSVFISGESGTGKEVLASYIHENSQRFHKSFIKVNCAAIAESLLESEFFGHEKGSFTGAQQRRMGRFELANQGTLLLDEVTEIPIQLQPKLLRAIQEQEFERVGSEKLLKVDVRIISTTNRKIDQAIKEGVFREDLYYRLGVVPIHIPPLRDRKEDILPLATRFLQMFCQENHKPFKQLSPSAEEKMLSYNWPGNVRELANTIERSVVLDDEKILTEDLLQLKTKTENIPLNLYEVEKKHILCTLEAKNHNKTHTAKALGISVRTLRNKLNNYSKTVKDSPLN